MANEARQTPRVARRTNAVGAVGKKKESHGACPAPSRQGPCHARGMAKVVHGKGPFLAEIMCGGLDFCTKVHDVGTVTPNCHYDSSAPGNVPSWHPEKVSKCIYRGVGVLSMAGTACHAPPHPSGAIGMLAQGGGHTLGIPWATVGGMTSERCRREPRGQGISLGHGRGMTSGRCRREPRGRGIPLGYDRRHDK